MNDENAELNEIMSQPVSMPPQNMANMMEVGGPQPIPTTAGKFSQWSTHDGKVFSGSAKTAQALPPGLYDIGVNPSIGLYFENVHLKTEGLLRFPHTNSEKIVGEIATFWDRAPLFEEYGLVHKRGIMLWGPPGSGKSCTIALVIHDVVARGGVAVRFFEPGLFLAGMHMLRDIQPETPVVVVMEDLDALVRRGESDLLNVLDGVEDVRRTVFLASTNYPELLGPRILNRPSRFDKRFKIGHPSAESRRMYLDHLIGKKRSLDLDLDQWVADTDKMSLAHLRELFVAVVILGDVYEDAVATLRSMKESISSESDSRERPGFIDAAMALKREMALSGAVGRGRR